MAVCGKKILRFSEAVEAGTGGILCFSAITKVDWLLQPYLPGLQIQFEGRLTALQVLAEVGLGCWLVSGLVGVVARRVAFATFVVFASYSAIKAFSGADSCGCFGRLSPSPYVSLAISSSLAALFIPLLSFRRNRRVNDKMTGLERWGVWAAGALLLVGVIGAANHDHPSQRPGANPLDPAVKIVDGTDLPSRVGKRFPLENYCSDPQPLMQGRQVVLLIRGNCEKCEKLVDAAEQNLSVSKQLHIIDISGRGIANGPMVGEPGQVCYHSLDPRWQWHFNVPTLVVLAGGIVREVHFHEQDSAKVFMVLAEYMSSFDVY